jgi:hypothetical protein
MTNKNAPSTGAVGWKLVPRTPTDEMMQAGLYQASHDAEWSDVYSSWLDMWDVAPALAASAPPSSPSERDAALPSVSVTENSVGYVNQHWIEIHCQSPADMHAWTDAINALRASRSDTVGPEAGE